MACLWFLSSLTILSLISGDGLRWLLALLLVFKRRIVRACLRAVWIMRDSGAIVILETFSLLAFWSDFILRCFTMRSRSLSNPAILFNLVHPFTPSPLLQISCFLFYYFTAIIYLNELILPLWYPPGDQCHVIQYTLCHDLTSSKLGMITILIIRNKF